MCIDTSRIWPWVTGLQMCARPASRLTMEGWATTVGERETLTLASRLARHPLQEQAGPARTRRLLGHARSSSAITNI